MSLPDDGPAPDEFDDRTLSEIKAEGRENLARLRDTPGLILGTWAVRVAIVAAVIWLVNWLLGPFARIWWLLPIYAVISLVMSFAMSALKNRQVDRIERIYDEDDAR